MTEPGVVVVPARIARLSAGRRAQIWLRRNMFRSWRDGIVTIALGALGAYLAFRAIWFVFVTGRWDVVSRNLTLFMVGSDPP